MLPIAMRGGNPELVLCLKFVTRLGFKTKKTEHKMLMCQEQQCTIVSLLCFNLLLGFI